MSAFIVNEKHLQALVNYAVKNDVRVYHNGKSYEPKGLACADLYLTVLHRQNLRSVDSRYNEKNQPDELKFKRDFFNYSPVQILKACDCYDYQSCETNDYEETFAYAICNAIRKEAIGNLKGYDDAEWEISTKAEVA